MPILEQLQNHFQAYVWRHVLSILVGLMLLRGAKTLTSLRGEEVCLPSHGLSTSTPGLWGS